MKLKCLNEDAIVTRLQGCGVDETTAKDIAMAENLALANNTTIYARGMVKGTLLGIGLFEAVVFYADHREEIVSRAKQVLAKFKKELEEMEYVEETVD